MYQYTSTITQLEQQTFITDGGLETTLVFDERLELPCFAAFTLLKHASGRDILRQYYLPYIDLAARHGFGIILESPTWRASADWGRRLGYDEQELAAANRQGVRLLQDLHLAAAAGGTAILISGCLGPRGDGYQPGAKMTAAQAAGYHAAQIGTFADAGVDLVSAYTLNYSEEAIGITRAAQQHEIPAVISFTLETDGRLPSGQPLGSAIEEVDDATGNGPIYFMINCAHPSHFRHVLTGEAPWLDRIRAVRANASRRSHAELDEATELDSGDPAELSEESLQLTRNLRNLKVFGGCCGTGLSHLEEICARLRERDGNSRPISREHGRSQQARV